MYVCMLNQSSTQQFMWIRDVFLILILIPLYNLYILEGWTTWRDAQLHRAGDLYSNCKADSINSWPVQLG